MNKGGGTGNFKLSPEQIHEASGKFDTVKFRALAKQYDVTYKTLVRAMRREGLLRPKKHVRDSIKLPPEKLEQALKMHFAGETLEKICETVDSTEWIVRKNLQAVGQYTMRRGRKPGTAKTPKPLSLAAQYLSKPLRVPL
jgi:hypothetical protein